MKKIISLLIIVCTLLLCFSACGANDPIVSSKPDFTRDLDYIKNRSENGLYLVISDADNSEEDEVESFEYFENEKGISLTCDEVSQGFSVAYDKSIIKSTQYITDGEKCALLFTEETQSTTELYNFSFLKLISGDGEETTYEIFSTSCPAIKFTKDVYTVTVINKDETMYISFNTFFDNSLYKVDKIGDGTSIHSNHFDFLNNKQENMCYVHIESMSMTPIFEAGDWVLIDKNIQNKSFAAGDIIAFWSNIDFERVLLVHRIAEVNGTHYITKGDANSIVDARQVSHDDIVGYYKE